MSALLKYNEDIYAAKHEMLDRARGYLRALVTQPHEPINFSIGTGRIDRGLDQHLPFIPGFEDERRELRTRIAGHIYQAAANNFAQAVDLTLTISRNRDELAPPLVVEEGEVFIAVDTEGHLHRIFLPPYHALTNAAAVTIDAGLSIECRFINPGYHKLPADDWSTRPRQGASNLPIREWRNRDPLFDDEEKWPPPSFLAGLAARGDAPPEPPETGAKLPKEVAVTVNPHVANRPSKPESGHEENADFEEENLESAPASMERALAAIAASHAERAATPHTESAPKPVSSAPRAAPRARARATPASPTARPAVPIGARRAPIAPSAQPQAKITPAPRPIVTGQPQARAPQPTPAAQPKPAAIEVRQATPQPPAPQPVVHAAESPQAQPTPQPAETARREPASQPEPRAEPQQRAEAPAETARAEPRLGAREEPRAEPRREAEPTPSEQAAQTAEATRKPAETPRAETQAPEPAHAAEALSQPSTHAQMAEGPQPTPQEKVAAPTPEPQTTLDQRTIKFAEKEDLTPHITQAGFSPAHAPGARQETSYAPAYVHLLEVPTHHHIYDALQPAQKQTPSLTQTAQLQTKMAAPKASPSLAPKIVPTPVPVVKSAPKQRLTRTAFLKRLLAPGLMPMPGGEPSEEA
jgi:hypothetical protein